MVAGSSLSWRIDMAAIRYLGFERLFEYSGNIELSTGLTAFAR
jgi:hypothetical protein